MKYIYNKFKSYTETDCDCIYCLYYGGKRKGCQLEKCCCKEERELALRTMKEVNHSPPKLDKDGATDVIASKCDNCRFASTGFICGDAYGPCMKNGYRADFSCAA